MIRLVCHLKHMPVRVAVPALRYHLLAVLVMAGMCACAAPQYDRGRPVDPAAYAMPPTQRPYNVFGVWYYPIPSALGFVEEGRASWYGPGFHGKQTSNGESYDMHALTAAHKTLPLGTLVKVVRTDNGKSVVVRLNDRGPFVVGRIIDLSYSAAHALDMVGLGTAPVHIEALQGAAEKKQDELTSRTSGPIPDARLSTFTISVGDYPAGNDADIVGERFAGEGHDVLILQVDTADGMCYRVCVGRYPDLIEAQISAAHLRGTGYAQACVITLDQE
jgi:rare lipoprotein A